MPELGLADVDDLQGDAPAERIETQFVAIDDVSHH